MAFYRMNDEGQLASKRPAFLAILLSIALCLSMTLLGCSGSSETSQDPQDGQASYKTEEEKQAELDRKVEEGMLDISIASVIRFENGTSMGTANIENVPGNIYDIVVTIQEEDTGETLYQSKTLKPNQYIEKIKLSKDLEPGSYPAIATFTAYNQETGVEEGEAAAKITIEVEG